MGDALTAGVTVRKLEGSYCGTGVEIEYDTVSGQYDLTIDGPEYTLEYLRAGGSLFQACQLAIELINTLDDLR